MYKFLTFLILVPFISFAQTRYDLDQEASKMKWQGAYVIGGGHEGTVKVRPGFIMIETGNKITKGEFIFDMTTIKTEEEHNEGTDLDDHLRSADFFHVEKFPLGYFNFVSANPSPSVSNLNQYNVTGILTLKSISNTIAFPATIYFEAGSAIVTADIIIDRTQWDIVYNSQSYFADLKDGAIANDIKVHVDLTFKMQ
jgi:polyisoprenoid-binding protein YceI